MTRNEHIALRSALISGVRHPMGRVVGGLLEQMVLWMPADGCLPGETHEALSKFLSERMELLPLADSEVCVALLAELVL